MHSVTTKQHPSSASFIRLYVLAFFFFAANSALTIILPLRSEAVGMNQAEIGLIMGAYMFTCMLLRPFAAQLIGRYGPLSVMKWLLCAHAVLLLLYTVSGTEQYIWLRALQGAITAFFSMTMQVGIVESLENKDRAQGLSMYTLFTMVPSLVIPIAALQIWQSSSELLFALLMIVLAAVPLLIFYRTALPKRTLQDKTYTLRDMAVSLGTIWKSPPMLISSIVMLLASCVFGATATFLPLFMLAAGSGDAGIYLTIQGLVVITCRFVLRKKIPSNGSWNTWLMAGLLLSAALGSQLLAMLDIVGAFVYVSAVCNGFAVALLYPTLTTYLSFILPEKSRYVLMAIFLSSYDLGFSLGGFAMGILLQSSSYPAMFTCCTLLSVTAALIIILSKRTMEVKPAP
ncbi:staphylopine family metallophore export MFS transporter CntE [Paenibacillus sp. Leaf72]|uniref:staphylopine family metallophore export MFS transporter CntE n=1 Tax=Paenibacillus sp. Leaf72 TaxID=1736234 RepID=UPI0006F9B508|nr:MFS transporter [Paenibacillus sp. Leaf72]KQO10618.1 MFS transporter [Paenibacillus sp. Leaf72]